MPDDSDPNIPEEPIGEAEETPSGESQPAPEGAADEIDSPTEPEAAAEGAGSEEPPAEVDPADALTQALLDQVNAAVSDVNSGIIGGGGEPAVPPSPMDMMAAEAELPPPPPPPGSAPMNLPSFPEAGGREMPAELDLLSDVNLNVKIELGRTRLLIDDVLRLGEGAVVELDKLAGDPVDIYVNDRHIARGEVLVLNDNFCVRVNEIVDPEGKQAG